MVTAERTEILTPENFFEQQLAEVPNLEKFVEVYNNWISPKDRAVNTDYKMSRLTGRFKPPIEGDLMEISLGRHFADGPDNFVFGFKFIEDAEGKKMDMYMGAYHFKPPNKLWYSTQTHYLNLSNDSIFRMLSLMTNIRQIYK